MNNMHHPAWTSQGISVAEWLFRWASETRHTSNGCGVLRAQECAVRWDHDGRPENGSSVSPSTTVRFVVSLLPLFTCRSNSAYRPGYDQPRLAPTVAPEFECGVGVHPNLHTYVDRIGCPCRERDVPLLAPLKLSFEGPSSTILLVYSLLLLGLHRHPDLVIAPFVCLLCQRSCVASCITSIFHCLSYLSQVDIYHTPPSALNRSPVSRLSSEEFLQLYLDATCLDLPQATRPIHSKKSLVLCLMAERLGLRILQSCPAETWPSNRLLDI